VGSLKLQVSFAKWPYKRDYILQKRPVILRSLLIVATPYTPTRDILCTIPLLLQSVERRFEKLHNRSIRVSESVCKVQGGKDP